MGGLPPRRAADHTDKLVDTLHSGSTYQYPVFSEDLAHWNADITGSQARPLSTAPPNNSRMIGPLRNLLRIQSLGQALQCSSSRPASSSLLACSRKPHRWRNQRRMRCTRSKSNNAFFEDACLLFFPKHKTVEERERAS